MYNLQEPIKRISSSTTNGNLGLQDLLQLFTEKETLNKEEAWYDYVEIICVYHIEF